MVPEVSVGTFPLGQKSSLAEKASRRGVSSISNAYSSPLSPLTATFSPSTSSTSFSDWLDEVSVPGWYLQGPGRCERMSDSGASGGRASSSCLIRLYFPKRSCT